MVSRLTLSALVAAISLTTVGTAFAKSPYEMTLEELRIANPPRTDVKACPMGDKKFWAHWATERGYEHILSGNMKEAADCYDKAAQMVSGTEDKIHPHPYYSRVAAILREIPSGAIDLSKETFEESAKRALKRGDKPLAAKLYELTAIGVSRMQIEGEYGRFGLGHGNYSIHTEGMRWQEQHLKSGEFFETATGLTTNPSEKRRLLQLSRNTNLSLLDTEYCAGRSFASPTNEGELRYSALECQQAQATITRLEKVLK